MFLNNMKLPKNIHFELFDLSFPGTNQYRPIAEKITEEASNKNRLLIKEHTGAEHFFALEQVHGTEVQYGDFERPVGNELIGDASYTDKKGVLLHIGTADCVPVIFFAEDGSVIGAAHAGWKGAMADIMRETYLKLAEKTNRISAIIAPSIFQKSYEVSADFYDKFLEEDKGNSKFFIESEKDNHKMFDIRSYVRHKLNKLDLENIYEISEDTYSHKLPNGEYKYPSYRRFCHVSGELYPRVLASTIMIKY